MRLVTATVILALASSLSAFGNSIVIFNTGESSGGTALPTGETDPHYDLFSVPAGSPSIAITTVPNPVWLSNTSTTDWISPGSSGLDHWPMGTYDYQTTFSLTGLNPATAELSGSWTSDNNGCIYLNGVNTGDCDSYTGFASLDPFSITSGFVAGTNTLDFMVYNGPGALGLDSPTGLFAEVSGTAAPLAAASVPEPSSLPLFAAMGGLLGLAVVRRQLAKR